MATAITLSDLKDYYESDAVETQVDFSVLKSLGFPTDGNPLTGLPATLPGAAWFALISAMRVGVIKASGLTPASTPDPLQFLKALQSLAWMNDKSIATKLLADSVITAEKIADGVVDLKKLNSKVIATTEQAISGTDNDVLMTPIRTKEAIGQFIPPSVPSGVMVPFAGTNVPDGWLLCNGAEVSRTTYASLFAAIGTKWGAGDGVSTFTLPLFHKRFAEGTTNPDEVGTYVEAGAPNITGEISCLIPWTSANKTGALELTTKSSNYCTGNDWQSRSDKILFNSSSSESLYGSSSTIQPQSGYALIIIKT